VRNATYEKPETAKLFNGKDTRSQSGRKATLATHDSKIHSSLKLFFAIFLLATLRFGYPVLSALYRQGQLSIRADHTSIVASLGRIPHFRGGVYDKKVMKH
jgi:uncharacterized protein (DUF924 family)